MDATREDLIRRAAELVCYPAERERCGMDLNDAIATLKNLLEKQD